MDARKTLLTLIVGGSLAMAGTAANAKPVGLGIVIDGSGSISSTEFSTQQNAYANVLGSNLIGTDGDVAVGVWQFSSSVQQVSPFQAIDSTSDQNDLVSDVQNMTQISGGTDIGNAIDTASQSIQSFGLGNLDKSVIDVSTDGIGNGNEDAAAQDAVNDGIDQVNCLGIEASADCGFIAGSDSFSKTATSFADVEDALEDKIARETGSVPAPAPLALLGAGLLGVGAARRLKADNAS